MPPATTKTATVAAYLRGSSQAQRQRETIASQREAVLDHGRSLGWAIPDDLLFADDGFSGATLERPALDALRDGVARGEIETVLVWSIDRLSRNFAHQILLQEEFARSGATIQCAQEPDDATPQGMLLRQILSVISEYERTQIAERSRRGKIHRARQGSLNMLTRAPYGYRLIRKTETCGARFEIDETEAGVVRRIFDLYAGEGLKMHQIARRLDEEGLSPRHSRHWPISTVAVILRNEAYIGKAAYLKTTGSGQRVRHNRTGRQKGGAVRRLTGRVTRPREDWIELPVPAIVDPALFARAQRQREANRRFSGRKTVEPTLLQGLCVCAHCGYAMGRNSGNSSRKTPRVHYYRCHGTEGWRHPEGAVCDNPAVRADELDAAVWTEVLALLEDPDLIQGEITRRLEAANDTTDIRQRTDSLQGELARITTRMRRLLDAYQEEVMTLDELREAKTPLQARQDSIQSELRSLKAAELDRGARLSLAASAEQFLGRLREGGRSLSLAERQRIVRLLVREVRVGKDAVTICHSIPIPASPPHGSDPSGDKPGQKKLLDSRCRLELFRERSGQCGWTGASRATCCCRTFVRSADSWPDRAESGLETGSLVPLVPSDTGHWPRTGRERRRTACWACGLTVSRRQCIISTMDDEVALAEIRRAAQAALEAWPEARAAVLFGSRARGNHHPDSDWDVAFIVRGDGERLGSVPSGVPFSVSGVQRRHYVNEIAIPERLVERKALCIGHVGRGIVADGMILAGKWTKPKIEGEPFMEAENYDRSMGTSIDMIEVAVNALANLGRQDGWGQSLRKADRFVACTADAAENLAKAVMGRHGLDARHSHDLRALADQARSAGCEALAEDILSMDGATREDHAARYEGATRKSLAHAIARLPVVLGLMRKELGEIPEEFLDPRERERLTTSAVGILSDCAATLRSAVARDGADMRPPDPYGWLKPLIESRDAIASALDATAEALQNSGKGSGNGES